MTPSLKDVEHALKRDFNATCVVAFEIEFYLSGGEPGTAPYTLQKEKGENQWEVALPVRKSAREALEDLAEFKRWALTQGANFAAKPLADQPGSGLHVHIHLEDVAGNSLYYKKDEVISDALKWSIGGLLANMKADMDVFAPAPASRARFVPGGTAPTTVSWGANNRTCAIRLPDVGAPKRHIEHRVAGADAEAEAVLACILRGIYRGLSEKIEPPAQTYGEAWRDVGVESLLS